MTSKTPQQSTWADRLAYSLAVLRGAVIILFSVAIFVVPEKVMPGSSVEPALTLAQTFASRSILLGIAFLALVIGRRRQGLAWVFLADAALQLFDTGMALATHKGALAALPAGIGIIDVWAGLYLLRSARVTQLTADE